MAGLKQSQNLGLTLGGWVEEQRAANVRIEDAALRNLAKQYAIDPTDTDWLRTLALALAIEHAKGFYKGLGAGWVSIEGGILGGKARVNYPGRAGRPTKKYHQADRELAVTMAAMAIQSRSPKVSLLRACAILHGQGFILPGDTKPLSQKVLYSFAVKGRPRYRAALAAALSQHGTAEKSEDSSLRGLLMLYDSPEKP